MSYIFFPTPTPIFPTLPPLAWSVNKKPIMASRVTTGATGRETQLACAVYPRWAFTLSFGGSSWLREQTQNIVPDPTLPGFTELQQLSGLYLACRGPYGEFYYEDPDDSSRILQFAGIGAGPPGPTSYPLTYDWGTGPFTPALTIPVGGIKTIDAVYFNGVLQNPNTYTMGPTNTELLFPGGASGGAVITVSFHFYFRCRFLDDHMEYSQFDRNLWENREVRFESVKP